MNQLFKLKSINYNNIKQLNVKRCYSTLNSKNLPNLNNNNNNNNNNGGDKKKSNFKRNAYLTLAATGVIGASYFYFQYLDNRDYMFSSGISNVSKESLESLKTIKENYKLKQQQQQQQQQQKEEQEKEISQDTKQNSIENSVISDLKTTTTPSTTELSEKITEKPNDFEKDRVEVQHDTVVPKPEVVKEDDSTLETVSTPVKRVVDEINQDEVDDDELPVTKPPTKEEKETNDAIKVVEEQDNPVKIVDELEKYFKQQYQEEMERQLLNLEKLEEITISNNEGDNSQINTELITEIVDELTNDIIRNTSEHAVAVIGGDSKSTEEVQVPNENVWKLVEKQYLDRIEALLEEKIELKKELDLLKEKNQEFLESTEKEQRDRYKEKLTMAVSQLNKELSGKLEELDGYVRKQVQENYSTLENTLTKQKQNLIGLFEQQANSIRQSELEKKLISLLSKNLLELRKIMWDRKDSDEPLQFTKQFQELMELSKYDEMIKTLVRQLPKGIQNVGIKDLNNLKNDFSEVAKECRRITLLPNDDSLLGKVLSKVAVSFIVPETGEGSDTDPTLGRAEEHLRKGNLAEAIKEVESVSKKSKQLSIACKGWLRSAKDRDQLENLIKLLELKLDLLNDQKNNNNNSSNNKK
ncbi:hypothetical protein DLAC_01353 [Tieghemostelium lacteum]|uniref:Mitofilin n=1 Tax=Tieghemostelium lacteum TaxID=361077 RepID=A0A152A8W1_TIELA|nr:hypothetical protein DLAC_01353 [Tieghemostelium lacteum]|eukprot:KYR02507.1 hypothetical protein DLAC_01353 [Tieghemostelium lacteum]